MRVFSFGGGIQSTAALVLAAEGIIDYSTFLFCNVGTDSEEPKTLDYVHEVAIPYAEKQGLDLIELHRRNRKGEIVTLYNHLTKADSKSIGIPIRMSGSGAPGRRTCTYDWKIVQVDNWCKKNTMAGYVQQMRVAFLLHYALGNIDRESFHRVSHDLESFFGEQDPIEVGLGISLDEIQRVKPNMDYRTGFWKVNTHPLIFEVPQPLTRQDCINVIKRAGLKVPPKSACWFCPFHTIQKWQQMRQEDPEHFWKAAHLEDFLNKRRRNLGMDAVWLTSKLKPLAEATSELDQQSLFSDEDNECEGHCFT